MCNCGIEAKNHFLFESLAACHDSNSKLVNVLHGEYNFCQLPTPTWQSDRDSWNFDNKEKPLSNRPNLYPWICLNLTQIY